MMRYSSSEYRRVTLWGVGVLLWAGVAVAQPASFDQPIGLTRLPVPKPEARQEVRQRVQGLFQVDKLKTPAEKKKLAAQLLKVGKDTKDDVVAQFVLFNMAREQALVGHDLDVALAAIDELAEIFQIDRLKQHARILYGEVERDLPANAEAAVAKRTLKLIDMAIAADRLDLAEPLAIALGKEAVRIRDVELRKRIRAKRDFVTEFAEQTKLVKPALDKLQVSPHDAEANLAYGKYLCFFRGDWAAGLPRLERGGDVVLKELAERDLAQPAAPQEQLPLAADWLKLADSQENYTRGRERAAHWYQQAHASGRLAALDRLAVERALKKLGVEPPAGNTVASTRPQPNERPQLPQPQPPAAEPAPEAQIATFVAPDQSHRIAPVNEGDGVYTETEISGVPLLVANKPYLYFRIDDTLMKDLPPDTPVVVRVTLLDNKEQRIDIEYDGHANSPQIVNEGRYRDTAKHQLRGTGRLKQVDFILRHPRLKNRQNYGGDFRIRGSKLAVHQVQVAKVGVPR